jgi:hypothetical protein
MQDEARQTALQGNVLRLEQELAEERERMRMLQPQAQPRSLPEASPVQPSEEAEWIKRDREDKEFQRKKRHMMQSRSFSRPSLRIRLTHMTSLGSFQAARLS